MDRSPCPTPTGPGDDIPDEELDTLEEAFDLFDFWDGRDGLIDGSSVGDLLRCVGLNPTNRTIRQVGGNTELGEEHYNFDDFLSIYQSTKSETSRQEDHVVADVREALKSFDHEGCGFISLAELRLLLTSRGEKLTEAEVDEILKCTEMRADMRGTVRYNEFIDKVMAGPADWNSSPSS